MVSQTQTYGFVSVFYEQTSIGYSFHFWREKYYFLSCSLSLFPPHVPTHEHTHTHTHKQRIYNHCLRLPVDGAGMRLNDDLYVVVHWKPVVSVCRCTFLFCECLSVCHCIPGHYPVCCVCGCQATMNLTGAEVAKEEKLRRRKMKLSAYGLGTTSNFHLRLDSRIYFLAEVE